MLIDSQPDLTVIGEANDGHQAIMLNRELQPDVILMDIRMPVLDGLEATRRILTDPAGHTTRIVVRTTYDLDEYVYQALRVGASGFLLKHAPPEELLLGIHAAAEGNALISPTITSRLIARINTGRAKPPRPPTEINRLTEREREVLHLAARGLSNTEIATNLHVAETTVKTHIAHTLTKLGLRDRIHAVIYAYETGLVAPGDTAAPTSE